MLVKKPGQYINGGCGATINLPHLNLVTECGLSLNFIPLFCSKCKQVLQLQSVVNIYG